MIRRLLACLLVFSVLSGSPNRAFLQWRSTKPILPPAASSRLDLTAYAKTNNQDDFITEQHDANSAGRIAEMLSAALHASIRPSRSATNNTRWRQSFTSAMYRVFLGRQHRR